MTTMSEPVALARRIPQLRFRHSEQEAVKESANFDPILQSVMRGTYTEKFGDLHRSWISRWPVLQVTVAIGQKFSTAFSRANWITSSFRRGDEKLCGTGISSRARKRESRIVKFGVLRPGFPPRTAGPGGPFSEIAGMTRKLETHTLTFATRYDSRERVWHSTICGRLLFSSCCRFTRCWPI